MSALKTMPLCGTKRLTFKQIGQVCCFFQVVFSFSELEQNPFITKTITSKMESYYVVWRDITGVQNDFNNFKARISSKTSLK